MYYHIQISRKKRLTLFLHFRMCHDPSLRMTHLLNTYSYTCNIVKSRYAGQLSANFPAAFFVAYQNWSEASRGYRVKEVSQELLQKVDGGLSYNTSVFGVTGDPRL